MRLASLCLAGLMCVSPAAADAVHTVRFQAGPVVLVWDEAGAAGAASFEVASNTGFTVEAVRADGGFLDAAELEAAGFEIRLAGAGLNAVEVGAPVFEAGEQGVTVYRAAERTARLPGEPRSQALAFRASWNAANAPGLSLRVQPLAGENGP